MNWKLKHFSQYTGITQNYLSHFEIIPPEYVEIMENIRDSGRHREIKEKLEKGY